MEDCVNEKLDDSNQNDLIEENETGVHDEVVEISIDTKNQDVIHIHMNVYEKETNWYAFEEVIYE